MKLKEILELLQDELVLLEGNDKAETVEITSGISCDLLSRVMAKGEKDCIWLTVQGHPNVVAIASLLEMGAVVFTENVEPAEMTVKKAKDAGVILLKSPLDTYTLGAKLYALGVGKRQ